MMDDIYTVTQYGVQLWQIYPMICTHKNHSYVLWIVQLSSLCSSAEFWIASKVLNVANNIILEMKQPTTTSFLQTT